MDGDGVEKNMFQVENILNMYIVDSMKNKEEEAEK